MSKRILMITYVFPPMAYAGTYRSLRLCNYLQKSGYSVRILTISEQKDLCNDQNLLGSLGDSVKIVRTPTIDPWRSYQKIKNKILGKRFGGILNRTISAMIYPFTLPDHMIFWIPFAFLRALILLRMSKVDVVYTSSPPHSEQIVGLLLKKMTGIPWVSDLRDPILDNLFWSSASGVAQHISRRLEQTVLNSADAVVANTRTSRDTLRARYPAARVHCIYNSYDVGEFQGITREKYERFTVAHVGSIYGLRQATHIIRAVRLLLDRELIDPSRFRVLFVGLNNPSLKRDVDAHDVSKVVEIMGMVSHRAALEAMVRSHLLLLIKAFGENSSAQIPGKFFEYLGSGSKILCVAPPDTELASLVREYNLGCVVGTSPEEIALCIHSEYLAFTNNGIQEPLASGVKNSAFSIEAMGSDFIKLFSTICT